MSYFYIIEHSSTGKLYAGARVAKNCHPNELLKKDGYITSSKSVKKLIQEDGLESFVVRYIKEFQDKIEAFDWESRFLRKIDAKNNERFLNCHNNEKLNQSALIKACNQIYGVDNPSQAEEVKEKIKQTNLLKHGVEWSQQNTIIRTKVVETCMSRFGDTSPLKNEKVKEKIKQKNLLTLGVEYPMMSEEVREKSVNACLEKYGVSNISQYEETKSKKRKSSMEKYGTENVFQSEEVKEKQRQTLLNRYGVDHQSKLQSVKDAKERTYLEKYGVTNPSKIRKICEICGFETSLNYLSTHMKKHASK